ncbi:cell wall-binding protein [Clostridium carboxidivorans P7]|uniref:Putative cell wall binding repeat 2-containing protein n=1 Tax=Clostridium carboxidivorans P7 TaxID=536227 RepID=C6PWJ8_9CLOT|nr:cell wall-binding repeat-containing protein [Clostridium carboxidivorans]AKN33469.1 cell wall-binding protein [Clostridium carboxidivorans P7]EET86409.1 putative cell wall binding repeat 2-containing protein [Clostridium carboxidivorans P7]EFG89149.1 hypothetical protein CLCAR_1024 [Clostridium carboxidivorans P7]
MNIKGRKLFASSALMSLILTTALPSTLVKASPGNVTRIGEADRYATAAKVAATNWTTSDNVILVTGEGYADAVSASALAKRLDAPILLTTPKVLNQYTESALSTLKVKNIYIIGGQASVSQQIREKLKENYTLVELGGANRYETNAAVANKLVELGVDPGNVMMVGGEGFSDALSVAPIAAAKGQILLLGMNDNNYMKSVLNFVNANESKVTVVGTKNVISDSILNSFNGTRIDGGQDRFDTNLKVLDAFKDSINLDKLYVASASFNANDDGYADALVASALAGKTASPLVLVDKDNSSATVNALNYIGKNANSTTDLNIIGGIGVVSKNVEAAINASVGQNSNDQATVKSIEAVNLNQFKVYFNADIDKDSAEDVTNYKIDGNTLTAADTNGKAVDENGAVAKAIDNRTVLITLAKPQKQYQNVTVSVKKAILTLDKNNTIASSDKSVVFSDTSIPTLKSITVEGNSKLIVEFSEAVDMKNITPLENKIKIDGESLSNYGISNDETLTKIKDSIMLNNSNWSNKIELYFDSPIASGTHVLKVLNGEQNGILSDAGGFIFREGSFNFTVDTNITKPVISSIKESTNGEVLINFDRSMDKKTSLDLRNYELNNINLKSILGVSLDSDNNDCTIKIKGLTGIKTGLNIFYVSNSVKDAYGNEVADDTRVSFNHAKDEIKPSVTSVNVIDSETIRVKFTKNVSYSYAANILNYKFEDAKGINITDHIRGIYSTGGVNDRSNTDTYDIKIIKVNPQNPNDDWRLTAAKYNLTIKNIIDIATPSNVMDDYTTSFVGVDDVPPKVTGIYYKQNNASGKDQVVIYFTEPMDINALKNIDNYKFINGQGESKQLPLGTNVSTGGDNKSVIIEFPANYHVKLADAAGNLPNTGIANDVFKITVSGVKDIAGNLLYGVAYTNVISVNSAGAKIKANTIKVYYDADDLKVDVQFDRAIDNLNTSDFTLGKITPTGGKVQGDKVTLIFKKGDLAASTEKAAIPVVTFANGKINNDENTTKIDLLKAQGQNAYLGIKVGAKTTDETGAFIETLSDAPRNIQNAIYDYEASPKTTSDYWSAAGDENGGRVYITFDTVINSNSGVKTDDFIFTSSNGTQIKADSVAISGNTVIFIFNKNNNNISAFNNEINVRANSTVSIRTERDGSENYCNYAPSSDDLKDRKIIIQ